MTAPPLQWQSPMPELLAEPVAEIVVFLHIDFHVAYREIVRFQADGIGVGLRLSVFRRIPFLIKPPGFFEVFHRIPRQEFIGFFVFEYQEEGFHVSFRELPQYQAGGFQYRCIHKLICLTILSAPPPFPAYDDFHIGILLQTNLQSGVEPVIDTQDAVYMDEVLAVGAEKDIGVELGFQLVERIRHGLGRAVVQAKERIAFVQSDVADIFHLHGNIAVAVRQKKTLAITVIALPHIFQ